MIKKNKIKNVLLEKWKNKLFLNNIKNYSINSTINNHNNTKTYNLTKSISPKYSKPLPPSFYKRPLPSILIPFSSKEGKQIFKEALYEGTMENYWTLAEQFHTQSEPAYILIFFKKKKLFYLF